MNSFRTIPLAFVMAAMVACSATPSKPVPAAAPTASVVADVSGKWILTVHTPTGAVDANMVIVQTGTSFKGTMDSPMGAVDFSGTVNGKEVKFTYSVEKFGAPAGTHFDYTGLLEAGAMKGTATFSTFGAGEWSAKRQ